MADVANLVVRVNSVGVDKATSGLKNMAQVAVGLTAALVSLDTATQVFKALVATQRNFDKLNSSLITVTGSADNAAKAFNVLQQFAKETPYGLNQAVEGFTKLVALGLNPSKEALISYGNTASAMGKDLNQMIEAVADAATGEFERLKEFGIKASQQGDKVSFTFQGVTTTVKKNSEEIQKYLLNIGNTNFAGAMEVRSKTLDGAISSLEDTIQGLALSVAQSGFGDFLAEQAKTAEDAVQDLTDVIASGSLVDGITDWVDLTNDSFKFISDGLNSLAFDFRDSGDDMKNTGEDVTTSIADGFRSWLPTVQEEFKNIYAEFAAMGMQAQAVGAAIKDAVTGRGSTGIGTYKALNSAIELNLDLTKTLNRTEAQGITDRSIARQKEIELNRKAYDERKKQETDLSKFGKGQTGGSSSGPDAAAEKAAKAAAKKAEQDRAQAQSFLELVQRTNADEIKAIDAKEQQKLAKAKEFYTAGALSLKEYEDAKTQIILEAGAARQDELDKREKAQKEKQFSADSFIEQIQAQNEGELAEIDRQQEAKLAKLQKFYDAGLVAEDKYQKAREAIADDADKQRLDSYTGTLGDVTSALKTSLGEGNALYKAAAITQTIIETYKGATAAYASLATIPVVGPALGIAAAAAITAAGLANVGKIRSAREQGGNLAAGQASTIAERGKAEVIMPAGASRVRTAQQMRQIMGEDKGGSGSDSVVIVNQTTGRIDNAQTERDDEGRLRVIIREIVSGDMQDSNSDISKSRKASRGQPGF